MESILKIIDALNAHLQEDWADEKSLLALLKGLYDNGIAGIKMLDFKTYNADKLQFAHQEKIRCVQDLDFERAANMRDIERICIEYEEFIKQHHLVSSQFQCSEGAVFYCYLGENETANVVVRLMDNQRALQMKRILGQRNDNFNR
jgi:hypothetical protein